MVENLKTKRKVFLKLAYSFGTYAILIWIGYLFSANTTEFAYTFLVGLGGAAVGNVLGLLASPYNRGERTSFSDYAKALATFVTGFLLSKLDKLLGVAADPDMLARHPIYGARVLVFLVAAVTGAIITYTFRAYYEGSDDFGDCPRPDAGN